MVGEKHPGERLQTGIEPAMLESERRFRSAFERADVGMAVLDLDGSLTAANQAFCRMLGYSCEQAVGRAILDLTHPDDAQATRDAARRLLAGDSEDEYLEKRYLREDGKVAWAEVGVFLVRDGDGRPQYFVTHQRDITARREAEREALQKSQVLDLILAASPVGIALVRDRSPVWASDAMAAMCGQSVAEHLRTAPRSLYVDEQEYLRVGQALYGDTPPDAIRRVDTCWVRADGVPIQVQLEARPLDAEPGEYIVTASDVTERIRHETELRTALERLRGLWDAMPGGVLVMGADGRISDANEGASEILGVPREALVGHSSDAHGWHLIREDGSPFPALERPLFVVLRTGAPVRDVVMGLCDVDVAQARWLLCNAEPLEDTKTGQVVEAVATFIDITDRKRAETALKASERRFHEMADLLPDMAFEMDADLRVTYINRAITHALGYTQADLDAGISVMDAMDEHDLVRAREGLADTASRGRPLIGVYHLRTKDGATLPTEVHAMAVTGADGQVTGYRGVVRDITDRERAEDAQRLAAVGQLAAGVAHEFNNLLAGLMLQAEVTGARRTAQAYAGLVRTALEVAARGKDVCKDLTAFARPETPRREPLFVESVVDQGLALAEHQIANAGIAVTCNYSTDGQRVHADAGQLEQVFVNLFVNACHAMPDGGKLTIQTRHVPSAGGAGHIVVSVADTGVGIRSEHLPRIFEPFFTTKGRLGESPISGSGLGLPVSHGIVEAHGGEIRVRSRLGSGTTFEVTLPAYSVDDAVVKEEEPPLTEATGARSGARVLVAEDAEALSGLIAEVLAHEGHEVVCAHTAQEAIEALQAGLCDLVITDLLMPGGGGKAVMEFVKGLDAPPPVMVITGLIDPQVEEEALGLGAARVLRKPFSSAGLTEAVDALLSA